MSLLAPCTLDEAVHAVLSHKIEILERLMPEQDRNVSVHPDRQSAAGSADARSILLELVQRRVEHLGERPR
jgi:hypothetical protein